MPFFSHLRVVEKEDHGLVVHPGLHEAALQILVPFHRPVVLRDLDLVSHNTKTTSVVGIQTKRRDPISGKTLFQHLGPRSALMWLEPSSNPTLAH